MLFYEKLPQTYEKYAKKPIIVLEIFIPTTITDKKIFLQYISHIQYSVKFQKNKNDDI